MAIRNRAFDAGFLRARRVDVPVVAVGNMTAGGTGKTPVVELLVRLVKRHGRLPAVVSRGYGRTSRGVVIVADREQVRVDAAEGGDEPVQIACKFPGIPVVVGERRYEAAAVAVRECGAEAVISDDGFQHRWLYRDCDVVVVDGSCNLAAEPLLPAGMRREPMRGLRRAHIVALTGCRDSGEAAQRTEELRRWFDGPVATIERSFEGVYDPRSKALDPVARLAGAACYSFSAIGNPARFVEDLVRAGCTIAGERRFRDHHRFTRQDLLAVVQEARAARAEVVLTTEKDLVRMRTDSAAMAVFDGALPLRVPVLTAREASGNVLEGAILNLVKGIR